MALILNCKGYEFLLPYIKKALPAGTPVLTLDEADGSEGRAIMFSSVDVYIPGQTVLEDEDYPTVDCGWRRAEEAFIKKALERGLIPVVLRCSPVVGTGMNGFAGQLARLIRFGLYFHFPHNDMRMSAVHAVDVAAMVAEIYKGCPLPDKIYYNVTDGYDPNLSELAEALAFRMNEKRISTLSTYPQQIIGRILYGRKYRIWHTDRTFSGITLRRATGVPPIDVCAYLRTHIYDDNSL